MPEPPAPKRAIALSYEHGEPAPRVTATGSGLVAERILAAARAAAYENPDERYHARVLLTERGLGAAGTAAQAQAVGIFLAIAQSLVDALSEEPREPVLLAYAGVAFYELWSLDAARAMFRSAL